MPLHATSYTCPSGTHVSGHLYHNSKRRRLIRSSKRAQSALKSFSMLILLMKLLLDGILLGLLMVAVAECSCREAPTILLSGGATMWWLTKKLLRALEVCSQNVTIWGVTFRSLINESHFSPAARQAGIKIVFHLFSHSDKCWA